MKRIVILAILGAVAATGVVVGTGARAAAAEPVALAEKAAKAVTSVRAPVSKMFDEASERLAHAQELKELLAKSRDTETVARVSSALSEDSAFFSKLAEDEASIRLAVAGSVETLGADAKRIDTIIAELDLKADGYRQKAASEEVAEAAKGWQTAAKLVSTQKELWQSFSLNHETIAGKVAGIDAEVHRLAATLKANSAVYAEASATVGLVDGMSASARIAESVTDCEQLLKEMSDAWASLENLCAELGQNAAAIARETASGQKGQ